MIKEFEASPTCRARARHGALSARRAGRLGRVLALTLGLALAIGAARVPRGTGLRVTRTEGYHDRAAVDEVVQGWIAAGLGERVDFEATADGREVTAVEFGPGLALPLAERRTLFLVGGLDGVSYVGGEAVLEVCTRLLKAAENLPADLSIIALPWASPESLAARFELGSGRGRNAEANDRANPGGDGGSGASSASRDRPDDLDGDGFVVEMLVEDPGGAWARDAHSRIVRPARRGDALRLARGPEGQDDDGDGLYNEDWHGAGDLDGSFPVGWSGARHRGLPLADPLARRLADLVFGRRTVGVILFQGAHGGLARPGGSASVPWRAADDAVWFDRLAALFASDTGRDQRRAWTLEEARGSERPGAALDWCFAVPGVLAVEVSPWGPAVALNEGGPSTEGPPTWEERERDWSRWLDDARAGLGFVSWHAVELGAGLRAWVGGWQPRTVTNPPENQLSRSLTGLADFTESFIAALPTLELSALTVPHAEGLTSVRVVVSNLGALPTAYSTTGRHADRRDGGVVLTLRLGSGARLLSGRERIRVPALGGGARSETVEWLVHAPEGTRLSVIATSRWCARVVGEVKL